MVARPTEYEYKILMDVGKYREAAVVAITIHERLRAEAEVWLDRAGEADLKRTLKEIKPDA